MRIKSLALTWFRGAADTVTLEPNSKSMVIYGENASGKSSFVDAVEYLLKGGKVGHLSHEYSGRHQEKGLLNTHMPPGKKAQVSLVLADGLDLVVEIAADGRAKQGGSASGSVVSWDYHRTVLRQDEVASFIRDTKGGKYSALLPLLGLQSLELAAENLRQLAKSVEQQSQRRELTEVMRGLTPRRDTLFGNADDKEISAQLETLHSQHCGPASGDSSLAERCDALGRVIADKLNASSSEQKEHLTIQSISEIKARDLISAVRSAATDLAASAEPLIIEKLEVLANASDYLRKLGAEGEVSCPACGRSIQATAFDSHLKQEQARLEDARRFVERRKGRVAELCHAVAILQSEINKPECKSWCDDIAEGPLGQSLRRLKDLDVEALRGRCDTTALADLESTVVPLVALAATTATDGPADLRELARAGTAAAFGRDMIAAQSMADSVRKTTSISDFLGDLEENVRQEIRSRSKAVIDSISGDIQSMWAILHPGATIEGAKLYFPEGADKAIDVQLKFHGIAQESPRLTLSEGYRNSLGLCIFLAMAKREAASDPPLFLDDVVVSMDRNHRGMIVELLEREFAQRQVILLTHDRDWYTELRHQLDGGSWTMKALLPYERPDIGIRWSSRISTFDDARALLASAADAAGNTARKIMDIELAVLAERLKVRLPYLQGYRNDHRTGHDFISQLIADGVKCFKKKTATQHEPYSEPIEGLKEAQRLLETWANKSSHGFDIVRPEAVKLIDTCDRALKLFFCDSCGKPVHRLDDVAAEFVQCQCGTLRWRYGKA